MELARQVAAGGFARGRVGASPAAYGSGGATSSFAYMPASPSQYAGNNARAAAGSLVPPSPSRGGGGPGAAFKPPPPRMGPPPPGSFSGASGGGGGHGGGRNGSTLVNRVVKVVGGQYNGYRGRVKHETGTHVQLELEAISGRVVTVPKNLVRDVAATAASGAFGGAGPAGAAGAGGYSGAARGVGSAPEYGTRTPLHPSQTPLHPSMTPAHYSMGGGATPAHAPYTPMHAPTPMDDSYNYTRPGDRVRAGGHAGCGERRAVCVVRGGRARVREGGVTWLRSQLLASCNVVESGPPHGCLTPKAPRHARMRRDVRVRAAWPPRGRRTTTCLPWRTRQASAARPTRPPPTRPARRRPAPTAATRTTRPRPPSRTRALSARRLSRVSAPDSVLGGCSRAMQVLASRPCMRPGVSEEGQRTQSWWP